MINESIYAVRHGVAHIVNRARVNEWLLRIGPTVDWTTVWHAIVDFIMHIRIDPGCSSVNMADSSSVVVCGVLCFIQNKIGYVPSVKLGEVVSKGFEEEEVVRAKDLIFEAASHVSGLRNVRKKVRKNTGTKNKVESDILHLCYEADRVKAELPRFAAVDINTFPHIPLEEVDGAIVMAKVASGLTSEIEGVMKSITASFSGDVDTAGLDCGAIAEEITSNFKLEVKETLKEFADKVE